MYQVTAGKKAQAVGQNHRYKGQLARPAGNAVVGRPSENVGVARRVGGGPKAETGKLSVEPPRQLGWC